MHGRFNQGVQRTRGPGPARPAATNPAELLLLWRHALDLVARCAVLTKPGLMRWDLLNVTEMRDCLGAFGLSTDGNKATLLSRLNTKRTVSEHARDAPLAAAANGQRVVSPPAKRRSLSDITVETVTETHAMRLNSVDTLPRQPGKKIIGPTFDVGNEKFHLFVYLGGKKRQESEPACAGIYLQYDGSRNGVDTSFTVRIYRSDMASPIRTLTTSELFATYDNDDKNWSRNRGWPNAVRVTGLMDNWATGISKDVVVEVDVTVRGEVKASALEQEEAGCATQVKLPPPTLALSYQALLESGFMSDMELKCGGTSVKAHKLLLSARSPVFAAMFKPGLVEAEANEVTLEGIEPAVLRSLVHYLYCETLPEGAMENAEGLLASADQYGVPRLVALCERELILGIDEANAAARLVLADKHHAMQLKEACLDFIARHSETVMQSEGWQQMAMHPNLLQELFAHSTGVRKRSASTSGQATDDGSLANKRRCG
eukprot:COSAG02_NODE_140_length_34374_cov_913.416443_2_plen_487_part_00